MTMRERMARAMCVRQGYDPDKWATGLGYIMPLDVRYRLWEAQLPLVDVALDELMEPTEGMLDAADDLDSFGNQRGVSVRDEFIAAIRAVKDEK